MDKRNKTALAYLLVGVAAAGRALLAVPENAAIQEVSLTVLALVGYLLLASKTRLPTVFGAAGVVLELILCGWGKGESICRYGQDGSKRNWIKKPMILIPLSLLTVKWRGRISRALSPTPPCWDSAESLTKARLTQSAKGWKGF